MILTELLCDVDYFKMNLDTDTLRLSYNFVMYHPRFKFE